MKLIITSLICLAAAGCAHSNTTKVADPNGPPNLVWCSKSQDCFEAAARLCDKSGDLFSSDSSKPGEGHWHQVAADGMSFPALVLDDKGWHMHFQCDQ